jgi:glutathione peroxidase
MKTARDRYLARLLCSQLQTTGVVKAVGHCRFASPQTLIALTLAALLFASPTTAQPKANKTAVADKDKSDKPGKPEKTAYDFTLPGPDGKDVPMTNFKGKYVLLVNLARKSTYNSQLPALIKLSDTYKDKGLVVIGVPSNDFGAEEPGTPAEIQKAYADAKVTFPVMAVSKLTGDAELPLFLFLTKGKSALPGGPVAWNYTKLFLGKDGKPITRLSPDVAPDSPEMLATVEQILGGRFKPAKKDDKPGPPGDDDDDE